MKLRMPKFFGFFLITALIIAGVPVFGQGVDPSTVKPAWQFEQEIEAAKNAPLPQFDAYYFGYDYPIISGNLAADLAKWESPINIALGFESISGLTSSFISGVELEMFFTFNDSGVRFLMNDLVLFGYSFDLKFARLNAGIRAGLSILDITENASGYGTFTALGAVLGPEISLYVPVAKDMSLYLRGRYAAAAYITLDSDANPIDDGRNQLATLSIQAGLAFKM
jgi:hypothetical protein